MAAKLDERITGLEEQLKQLRTRQQRIEARKRALLSRRERAADTRRKILVGAIVLAKVEQGELDAGLLRGWLDAGAYPQGRSGVVWAADGPSRR